MNEYTFKTELIIAFEKTNVEKLLKIIATYFDKYDSYAQKDFISLMGLQKMIRDYKHQGLLLKSEIEKWEKEIKTRRDNLIEQLIVEKREISKEDYEDFELKMNDAYNTFFDDENKVNDVFKMSNEYSYYKNKLNEILLLYESGLEEKAKKTHRVNLINVEFDLLSTVSNIRDEKKVNHRLNHRNKIQDFPEIITVYQSIANNEISDLMILLMEKVDKYKYRLDLYIDLMSMFSSYQILRKNSRIGLCSTNDYLEKHHEISIRLVNKIFHGDEIYSILEKYNSRSLLRKLVDWLDVTVK